MSVARSSIGKYQGMNYTEFNTEDFVMDISFQNFCLKRVAADVAFWENFIAAHPQKKDEIIQAEEMYRFLSGNLTKEQIMADSTDFNTALHKHIAAKNGAADIQNQTAVNKTFKWAWLVTAAAAAVVIFMVLLRWNGNILAGKEDVRYEASHISKKGERKSFQLPDGSKVTLNAGSIIKIDGAFNKNTREISLEGEAFFDVAYNASKPFIIHTLTSDIKVLGTVFNVKAYPADSITETSLISGSVEVTLKNTQHQKVILHPNEKIILPVELTGESAQNKKTASELPHETNHYRIAPLTLNPVDSSLDEVSWTDNRLSFNNTSLHDIAKELERWYNISITFKDQDVEQYKYSAIFDKKNIVQVLDALQLSRRFTYRIEEGNKIIINK